MIFHSETTKISTCRCIFQPDGFDGEAESTPWVWEAKTNDEFDDFFGDG